jgi:hypothetical protein
VPASRRLGHGEGPAPGRKKKRLGLWLRELKKSRSLLTAGRKSCKSKSAASEPRSQDRTVETHYVRSNKYTLMYNEKKITLLPLIPNEIVQCDRAIAGTVRRESEIHHASPIKLEQRAPSSISNAIKLQSRAMLATKSDLTVSINVDISFYALVCRQVLFSLEYITPLLLRGITNLLQEFNDVFPVETPRGCHI